MLDTIKSELRKLLTIRSTYMIIGLNILLIVLMAFYIQGIRTGITVETSRTAFSDIAINAALTCGTLSAIIAILMLSHEYRYNTITYTLTASRSRTKVLLAKIAVLSAFSIVYTLAMTALTLGMLYLGAVVVKGYTPVHQDFAVWDTLWRVCFYGWGNTMIGLLFTALIRNQVGAIVGFLITPIVVEQLLGFLLRSNSIYLPFIALQRILSQEVPRSGQVALTHASAALVVCIYLAVGWLIAWLLFLRRDAN
ncbi:MAG TPA: ABC transporter permease [Candidatus Saccharimonadales bacterium]|nr:ABC transporter permease [Candidatus Saccharimonadales bacterium]